MKTAVITFPGSNCDRDMYVALEHIMPEKPVRVWHEDSELPEVDLVVIPGGFSYGDYLRCGAIASKSRILNEIVKFADNGGYVLGICNGFQVLCESGLLPGVLMRNRNLKFICKTVNLKVENSSTRFTSKYTAGQNIKIPVAHHDGNYFADDKTLAQLENGSQIAFRYANENGDTEDTANPNGSQHNIAGIFNKNKNVLGMMPHPERAFDKALGGEDGRWLFESFIK